MTTSVRELPLTALGSFFEAYAEALGSGDPVQIAACYELPAMVLRRDGASVTIQRHQVVEAFTALLRQEPARWCRPAVPVLRCVELLDSGLVRADVEWHDGSSTGGAQDGPERYVYLLRTVSGRPRIHVAVGPLPVAAGGDGGVPS
jgi:hypothetical protein